MMKACHHALGIVFATFLASACAELPQKIAEHAVAEEVQFAPGPSSVASHDEITQFAATPPGPDDLVARFGEPFIDYETRGSLVLVRDFTSGEQVRRIAEAERTNGNGRIMLRLPGEEEAPHITIEPGACLDEFSGETSGYIAWLETGQPGLRIRGCANRL